MMYIVLIAGFVALSISPLFFFSMTMLAVGLTVFVVLVLVGRWYWTVVITESEVVGPKANGLGKVRLQRQGIAVDERPTAFVSDGAQCLIDQSSEARVSLWGMDESRRNHLFDLVGLLNDTQGCDRR